MRNLFCIILFLFVVLDSSSQVWISVTEYDLKSVNKQAECLKKFGTRSSLTWKVTVKDNVISTIKILFSETFYNENGMPKKIVYFDKNKKIEKFTLVRYNSQKLPFEEITFSADSILLGGSLYEYDNNNLLSRQTDYADDKVTNTYKIERLVDSIYVSEVDSLDAVITCGYISSISEEQTELHINQAKRREQSVSRYDILSEITKKHIVGNAGKKMFIYENNNLVKSAIYNDLGNEISSVSFEYDKFGNIGRIIERCEPDRSTNVYMIKYY